MMEQKILAVDDDKVTRFIVGTAFRRFTCTILEAADGVQGLAVTGRERPCLILLDHYMPVMNGMEMLTRLKANPETRNIPVLMLTADSRRDTVLRMLRLGVKDYLIKPITLERMLERASRIVELTLRRERRPELKRSNEPLQILVVDDKPAITELIQKGFAGTPWKALGLSEPAQAVEACNRTVPDLVLISLSLPQGAGFSLFRTLRASAETQAVPILALSVKTALEEQTKALEVGFAGIVTKPINLGALRYKIIRALGLDTSHLFFQRRNDTLCISLPVDFDQSLASEITKHLRERVFEAVNAGVNRIVIERSLLSATQVTVPRLGLEVIKLCSEFGLHHVLIGSEAVSGGVCQIPGDKGLEVHEVVRKGYRGIPPRN